MEFFEFSSDALYPSFDNELIVQPFETTDFLVTEQPTEEFLQSQTEGDLNNITAEFAMENIARTHPPVPHPVTSVTSSNSNDWISIANSLSESISSQQGMTETPTNYPPPYSNNSQPSQFPITVTTAMPYSSVTQEIRSVASSIACMQHLQYYPEPSSQSTPRNINNRFPRSQNHPYFRAAPTSHQARVLEENNAISRQRRVTFSNPANSPTYIPSQILLAQSHQRQENFELVNSMPENRMLGTQQQSGQESSATTVNNADGITTREATNASQQSANVIQLQAQTETGRSVPVTSRIDSTDRATLPVQQVLCQLVQTIKSPNCTTEQQYQVVRMLRNNPRLMAAFLQMKQRSASQYSNASNNMATNQQHQLGSTYRPPWNPRFLNSESTTQLGLMAGGSLTVSSSAVPHVGAIQNQGNRQHYNVSSSGCPTFTETGRWIASSWNNNQPSSSSSIYLSQEINNAEQDVNNRGDLPGLANSAAEPAVTAVLQLAAARRLLVQAAASAAAAGAKSLSRTLNDRTHSLDRVMNAHCPSFLHGGRTQMEALSPLTSSANSQLSAPRIPTCSICLDKLVSTIVFPCRHFFCETCAPKIEKCGLCRELIEDRHRVYF